MDAVVRWLETAKTRRCSQTQRKTRGRRMMIGKGWEGLDRRWDPERALASPMKVFGKAMVLKSDAVNRYMVRRW